MRSEIQNLIDDVKARRWNADPYGLVHSLIDSKSPYIDTFVEMALEQLPDAGTFFNDAISFVPEESLSRLAHVALRRLRSSEPDTAEDFISHCSLQQVEALHPFLADILMLGVNKGWHTFHWPWRASGGLHFAELTRVAASGSDPEQALDAWRILLEKRHPMILDFCIQSAPAIVRAIERAGVRSTVAHEFLHVGFELKNSAPRQLYSNDAHHIVFPETYWLPETAAHLVKRHPTWRGAGAAPSHAYAFGGLGAHTCLTCGERGHRLIAFDVIPDDLPVLGLAAVTFETCLSCINWSGEPLFYQHAGDGGVCPVEHGDPRTRPEFTYGALVETEVRLAPSPARWQWQDWGLSNGRQNLSRVGGHPCWIQYAEYLKCPLCSETMHSLFQLDSELVATADDGSPTELLWGSGGICYVQWCDRCKVSGYVVQCT